MIETTRPAYRHNRVLIRITSKLYFCFEINPIGEVLNSENLYALSSRTRRAPDAAIVLGERRRELAGPKVIQMIPDIAVEVLSPNERPGELQRKLTQYFRAGVKEVWILDPEANTAEIWTGPTLPETELTIEDSLRSALLPGFALPPAELFA